MKEEEIKKDKYEEIKDGIQNPEFQKKEQMAIDYVIEQIQKIDYELREQLNREMVDMITHRI